MQVPKVSNSDYTFCSLTKTLSSAVQDAAPALRELEQDTFSYGVRILKIGEKSCSGKKLITLEIDGNPYKFRTDIENDEKIAENLFQVDKSSPNYKGSLAEMVDNIRETIRGFFVKEKNHEYFISNLHPTVPDILTNKALIRYGNKQTVDTPETRQICKIMSYVSNNDVKLEDLKTIEYLARSAAFGNNERRIAYSYYDEVYDMQYYFRPEKSSVKAVSGWGHVDKIKVPSENI